MHLQHKQTHPSKIDVYHLGLINSCDIIAYIAEIYLKHIQTTFDISGQKVQLASSLEFSFDFIRECTLAAPAVKAL